MELNAKQPQQATSAKFNRPNFISKRTVHRRVIRQGTEQICKNNSRGSGKLPLTHQSEQNSVAEYEAESLTTLRTCPREF